DPHHDHQRQEQLAQGHLAWAADRQALLDELEQLLAAVEHPFDVSDQSFAGQDLDARWDPAPTPQLLAALERLLLRAHGRAARSSPAGRMRSSAPGHDSPAAVRSWGSPDATHASASQVSRIACRSKSTPSLRASSAMRDARLLRPVGPPPISQGSSSG